MCFSIQQSFVFTLLGAALTAGVLWTGRSTKFAWVALYFTLMELLQTLQYLVIDNCSSKANQLLTLLGIVHIAFQPLVVNEFLWGNPKPIFGRALASGDGAISYPAIQTISRRLCLAAAALTMVKALPAVVHLLDAQQVLSSLLAPALSPRLTTALLTNTCNEMACGPTLCSLSGRYHLAWSVPMMAAGYYVPHMFSHFMLMFFPGLLCGGRYQRIVLLFVFVSGPMLSELLVWQGGPEVRRLEWPAIWCLFSSAQVLAAFGLEVVGNGLVNGKWTLPAAADDTMSDDQTASPAWAAVSTHDSTAAALMARKAQ